MTTRLLAHVVQTRCLLHHPTLFCVVLCMSTPTHPPPNKPFLVSLLLLLSPGAPKAALVPWDAHAPAALRPVTIAVVTVQHATTTCVCGCKHMCKR